eukprot:Gregarina_sp_Poly_1__8445@NODE_497_length_7922_cov_26_990834_g53_i1_p2_GENE_NODE_497_length_7922_cov_26_990834_g53_i1NODE_497_length_7922_cov_26_990834_g53_i1_p2_ORF_typecomplete_len226_score20_56Di19_C/PF14571_6/2_4e02Di19_C/PF14571_6/3_3LRRNT_2/PF08263_12/52LRRNT_2/PF08263_12/4_NODE_497_length_7922_cov_26_990834_g53_i138844561
MTVSVCFDKSKKKSVLVSHIIPLLSSGLFPLQDAECGSDMKSKAEQDVAENIISKLTNSNHHYFRVWAHLLLNDSWANERLQQWYKSYLDLMKEPCEWKGDPLALVDRLTFSLEESLGISFLSDAKTPSAFGSPSLEALLQWKSDIAPPAENSNSPFLWSFLSSMADYEATARNEMVFVSKLQFLEKELNIEDPALKALWRFIMVSLLVHSPKFGRVVGLHEFYH